MNRRQFLLGCATTTTAFSGLFMLQENNIVEKLFKSIPILLYHRVGPELDNLTISVKRFRNDMETLHEKGYQALSLEQVQYRLHDPAATLPNKPIVITFDDGYLDNYTNAFPILLEYSMKASFYIITSMVGQDNRMTSAQIREMASEGMDFGSHTVTHRPLAELASQDIDFELNRSKSDLEQLLGKSVNFIAYPCGSYSEETLKATKKAGYLGGFSTRYGLAAFNDNLLIRRIPIFHFDRSISYVMLRKGLLPSMFS